MSSPQDLLEGIGWKARGDREAPKSGARPFFPRLKHAFRMIPTVLRICIYTFKLWWIGQRPFISIFQTLRHFAYTGVPMGGIGCGSIGTDFRGAFGRFSIIPGIKEQMCGNIKANQFIVTVHSSSDDLIYQSLLSCADFEATPLKSWKTMPAENVRYRGLFPRAWREFVLADTGITVVCEQVSPVIPNDYKNSSLPVTNFEFHVINDSSDNVKVSITFTFRNGTGNKQWNREDVCETRELDSGNCITRTLAHYVKKMHVTYGIAAQKMKNATITTDIFDPTGNGKSIYQQLADSGNLAVSTSAAGKEPKELGIAVCSSFEVQSSETQITLFSLVWYMPEVHFGTMERTYKRRYTRFFSGASPFLGHSVTKDICSHALEHHKSWQEAINEWQKPVLDNDNLPEWYRSALFNELYYICDGSTVWFEYDDSWKKDEPLISDQTKRHLQEYGRFGYMESWEYYMFNTYDVHFYSSWAILKNWPEIEMSIQLDFADQVCRVDKTQKNSLVENEPMMTKMYARVPHDMGHPRSDPWIHTNSYILHDTAEWRDLNLKFVISCWRDWKMIVQNNDKDNEILKMFYEKSRLIVDRAISDWDTDNDGMIENSGTADQTYDVWTMTGTSAYCGSLWLASLVVFVRMADKLGHREDVLHYSKNLTMATSAYLKKLWNGRFFSFDENVHNRHVVMADQLSGIWMLKLCGEKTVIEDDMVISALQTVYDLNVCSHGDGKFGAVNGFLTTGEVDISSIQSEEAWAGIVYAVASHMIEMGKHDEAFHTAGGLHNSIWNDYPLQYQTPESITSDGMYRAIGYMRPMSIWAMQHSLEKSDL